jgi:hypothetical protein
MEVFVAAVPWATVAGCSLSHLPSTQRLTRGMHEGRPIAIQHEAELVHNHE